MTAQNDNTQPYDYEPAEQSSAAQGETAAAASPAARASSKRLFKLGTKAKLALAGAGIAIASVSGTAAVMAATLPTAQVQQFGGHNGQFAGPGSQGNNSSGSQNGFGNQGPMGQQGSQSGTQSNGTTQSGSGSASQSGATGSTGSSGSQSNMQGSMPMPPQGGFGGSMQQGQGQQPSFGNQSNATQNG